MPSKKKLKKKIKKLERKLDRCRTRRLRMKPMLYRLKMLRGGDYL